MVGGRRLVGYTFSSPHEPNGSGELKYQSKRKQLHLFKRNYSPGSDQSRIKPAWSTTNEPHREKTCLRGVRAGPKHTGLYCHRNFGFRDCTVYVAKTKVLVSCAVTFVFAYGKAGFFMTRLKCSVISTKYLLYDGTF